MTNIIHFDDFENSEIRATEDGRFSVFDVIKFCGKKNPRDAWKSLANEYIEVVAKTDNFKFSGRGQQETPVANRENILYIIGLLPGAIGKAYREESAKIFVQYLDASPELAESVIDRATPETLKRIEDRLKSKKIRATFTTVLQEHGVSKGWEFAKCTDAIYKPILGGTTKEVKQVRSLANQESLRDQVDDFELTQIMFAESLAERKIKKNQLYGFNQCEAAASESAKKVKEISES